MGKVNNSAPQDKKQNPAASAKKPLLQKKAGPGRNELGQFSSGSGGLFDNVNLNWKRILPVVLIVAIFGGFLVYRSMAATALIAFPGSGSGAAECTAAGGTVAVETGGAKRNANVCQLSSGKTLQPVIFGNGTLKSTNVTQYLNITKQVTTTGYVQVCYNLKKVGTATAGVEMGGFTAGTTNNSLGTQRVVNNTDYDSNNPICDPVTQKAGTSRPFIRVNSGSVRVASVTISPASATPPPPPTTASIAPGVSFFWPIGGELNISQVQSDAGTRKLVDFDSFETSNVQSKISQLKALGNVHVVCYFSAGTAENWRSDYNKFTAADKSGQLDDWEGEYILDTRSSNVRSIMASRISTMKSVGCDGVEPDNVDGYSYNSGFPLTKQTALDYLDFLQKTAHDNGMTVALKNSGDLVGLTLPSGKKVTEAFDWALIEECYQYNECDSYRPFVQVGKAAVIVEYGNKLNCTDANSKNYDAYKMNLSLNGNVRTACRTL